MPIVSHSAYVTPWGGNRNPPWELGRYRCILLRYQDIRIINVDEGEQMSVSVRLQVRSGILNERTSYEIGYLRTSVTGCSALDKAANMVHIGQTHFVVYACYCPRRKVVFCLWIKLCSKSWSQFYVTIAFIYHIVECYLRLTLLNTY